MDEHEQGEQVRAWLRDNGATIITGILVGIAGIVGFNWWQAQQVQRAYEAGNQYQQMVNAADRGEHDLAQAHAERVADEHSGSPYAVLVALRMASVHIELGDAEAAQAALERARGKNDDPALDDLLDLRAARLQIAAGDHEGALSLLDQVSPAYAPMALELRGDALRAMGRHDEARSAYQNALAELQPGAPSRQLLELKVIDLGGTVDSPEA